MKRLLVLPLVLLSLPLCGLSESDGFADLPSGAEEFPAPTSAEELLEACRNGLPAEPVRLTGWLRCRKARGSVIRSLNLEATLNWADAVPTVQYTFYQATGALVARATFRHAGSPTEMIYQTGAELEPTEAPAWNSPLFETDMTWLDASMDFLHWEQAELAGAATVRGRLCDLVEVYPPQAIPGCKKVRLWVDRAIRMFLQVQQVDEEGLIQRQMWVRSVKKMGERWMVQDMEVEARNSGHRTRLHVLSCE